MSAKFLVDTSILGCGQQFNTTSRDAYAANRERSAILSDRAEVNEQLARLPIRPCDGACADRARFKRAAIEDQLAALDAEAQAAFDAQQSALRWQGQLQKVTEDLVGSQLASSLSMSYSTATWIMALTYALILEGVGCLCWAVVLRQSTSESVETADACNPAINSVTRPITDAVLDTVTESSDLTLASAVQSPLSNEPSPGGRTVLSATLLDDLARVTEGLRDSTIRPTVSDIRRLLQCSQARAQAVRKLISSSVG